MLFAQMGNADAHAMNKSLFARDRITAGGIRCAPNVCSYACWTHSIVASATFSDPIGSARPLGRTISTNTNTMQPCSGNTQNAVPGGTVDSSPAWMHRISSPTSAPLGVAHADLMSMETTNAPSRPTSAISASASAMTGSGSSNRTTDAYHATRLCCAIMLLCAPPANSEVQNPQMRPSCDTRASSGGLAAGAGAGAGAAGEGEASAASRAERTRAELERQRALMAAALSSMRDADAIVRSKTKALEEHMMSSKAQHAARYAEAAPRADVFAEVWRLLTEGASRTVKVGAVGAVEQPPAREEDPFGTLLP